MPGTFRLLFNQGLNTAASPEELKPGEMTQADGIYYKQGDISREHTVPGRTAFGDTGTGQACIGLLLTQYDTGGVDRVLTYSSGIIYSATPGITGSFSALISGLSTSATVFGGVHWDDRWYLYNGVDNNKIVESDGTSLEMGMISPQVAPIVTSGAAGTLDRPTAYSVSEGSWSDPTFAYDTGSSSFAGATSNTALENHTIIFSGLSSSTASNRILTVRWRLVGFQMESDANTDPRDYGVGGGTDAGFTCYVTISVSFDDGATYTQMAYRRFTAAIGAILSSQINIDNAVNSNQLKIKANLYYLNGNNTATLRVYDIKVVNGSPDTLVTTAGGLYYAVTEYDGNRDFESPVGPVSNLINISGAAQVNITLPSGAQNSNSTVFRIYRTPDGGSAPSQLGLIGEAPITQTIFTDYFETAADTQPAPPLPMVEIEETGGTLRVPRDSKAPVLKHLNVFKGSLVGVNANNPRDLRYSYTGFPNSWPEINLIRGFPFIERDELVATATVGDFLLIFAKDNVARTTALPQFIDGKFDAADISLITGQPGAVGPKAVAPFSVAGEPRVAWVSNFGIHITDGNIAKRITTDLDWESLVNEATLSSSVLFWDDKRHILIFSYDSDGGGSNDFYLLVHMDPSHEKENGQPIITRAYGSINDLDAGFVNSVYQVYSAHSTDGKVYLEWNGATDASNSYDSNGNIPSIMKTGKVYGNWDYVEIYRASLRSSDFGTGQTATYTWRAGIDNGPSVQTVTGTVSLAGERGHEFFIGRNGEWHELTISRIGTVSGSFKDVRVRTNQGGDAGKVS